MDKQDPATRAIETARRAITEGEEIVEHLTDDLAHAPPVASPPPPLVDDTAAIVARVIAAERDDRWITAAVGLIGLREHIAAGDHGGHERALWRAFVKAHFPFSIERADALVGRLIHRHAILYCEACGKQTLAECACGAPYVRRHPWATAVPPGAATAPTALQRAIAALRATPEKSNRMIAQELGIGKETVRRARDRVAHDGPPA